MCITRKLLSALDVMNARWDYRGCRSMSVIRIVDGSGWSMKMVDGHDGGCRDGNFLSWRFVCTVLFWILNF